MAESQKAGVKSDALITTKASEQKPEVSRAKLTSSYYGLPASN
jgi:hypothetical protein